MVPLRSLILSEGQPTFLTYLTLLTLGILFYIPLGLQRVNLKILRKRPPRLDLLVRGPTVKPIIDLYSLIQYWINFITNFESNYGRYISINLLYKFKGIRGEKYLPAKPPYHVIYLNSFTTYSNKFRAHHYSNFNSLKLFKLLPILVRLYLEALTKHIQMLLTFKVPPRIGGRRRPSSSLRMYSA
jgi:hypothetical protein